MSGVARHVCPGTDDDGRPLTPEMVTCGICDRSWCERCDPAPSALCVYCHGPGRSTAPIPPRQARQIEENTMNNTPEPAQSWVTEDEANAVYDILRDECRAPESDRASFVYHQTHEFVSEWRFQGSLGFGGKVYRTDARGRWRVSMYREDETPERLAAMAVANEALLRMQP